jgi:hypothetical protein
MTTIQIPIAEYEKLKADAERYRFLRNHPLDGSEEETPCIRAADNDVRRWALNGAAADAAIDAAINMPNGEGGE